MEVICYIKAAKDFDTRDCCVLADKVQKSGMRVYMYKENACADVSCAQMTDRLCLRAGDDVKLVGFAENTQDTEKQRLLFADFVKTQGGEGCLWKFG